MRFTNEMRGKRHLITIQFVKRIFEMTFKMT